MTSRLVSCAVFDARPGVVPIPRRQLRAAAATILAILLITIPQLVPPGGVNAATDSLGTVVSAARQYADVTPTQYVWGAAGKVENGTHEFDCSGFIYAIFKESGLARLIGGQRLTVQGYLDWFRSQGRAYLRE